VSAEDGWVLGTAPSNAGTRLVVAVTHDGGAAWASRPGPDVAISSRASARSATISFANGADGWITAPSISSSNEVWTLWSSHDGGASWSEEAVPTGSQSSGSQSTGSSTATATTAASTGTAGSGSAIAALAASAGVFQLVTITTQSQGTSMHLYFTPATRSTWAPSKTSLPIGAGPVPSADLFLEGAQGWLVEDDRVVVAGARLSEGAWARWTPPCTDANGSATIAASSSSALVAVCDEGEWGPPAPGTTAQAWLCTSADGGTSTSAEGGTSFAPVGQIVTGTFHGPGSVSSVATPPGKPKIVVVGGLGLAATDNGGHTWKMVYSTPTATEVHVIGFTTASQGIAIATGGTGASTLLMTHDAGSTWSPVDFSAPA